MTTQVVGLTLFDLRRLGKVRLLVRSAVGCLIHLYPKSIQVDKLGMAGVSGGKFPAIRQHLQENIAHVYKDMDI